MQITIAAHEVDVIGFTEIVIITRAPKQWQHGLLWCGKLLCKSDGLGGFNQGIEGAPTKCRLLTSNDEGAFVLFP
jgi:hypothetical protein